MLLIRGNGQMGLNNKGQTTHTALHIFWGFCFVCIIIWLVYSATHTHTEKTINLAGSAPQETNVTKGFLSELFELNLSCIPHGLINKTYNNGVNNAVSSNSKTNSNR